MKSVCMLVQNFYDGDIRVRRKAEALVAAGYVVDVLALASPKAEANAYVLNGVNVQTLSLGKQRGSLVRYAFEYGGFLVWCFFKLFSMMAVRRYSVIDINNLPDFLVFAAVWAKWRGAKVLFDMHEITPEFYISKYRMQEDALLVRMLKMAEKASFTFADHVLVINEPIKKLLEARGLPAFKTTVLMNSVDQSLFESALTAPAKKESKGQFIMMYHGTLTHIYGLDVAIEALARAQQQLPNAEFWILGGGPEKPALEKLAVRLGVAGKVKFIGNVLPQEVPQWLSRCDIGVLPTRRDVFLDYSFSNKLSEYIIMGKGVICSRLNAIRHYFSDEALTYFEPQDPTDLARQMVKLARDAELRERKARQAQQEYEPINWSVMKARYLAVTDALSGVPASKAAPYSAPVPNVLTRA